MAKNPSKPKMSESQLVNLCIRWLLAHGCFVQRNNTGAYKPEGTNRFIRFGKMGSPDITGLTANGRWIGVECKVGYNKLSPHQEAYKARIEEKKGIYIVARSLDDLELHKNEIKTEHFPARYADGVVTQSYVLGKAHIEAL